MIELIKNMFKNLLKYIFESILYYLKFISILAQTPQQKAHGRNTRCHTSADGFLAHRCRYALACAYIYNERGSSRHTKSPEKLHTKRKKEYGLPL